MAVGLTAAWPALLLLVGIVLCCIPAAVTHVRDAIANRPRRARTIAPRPVQATGRHRALEAGPEAEPAARYLFQLNAAADTAQQSLAAAIHAEEGR